MPTVLLVEDNQKVRDLVKFHLTDEGYQVLEAENGRDGVELAKENGPEIVILDVMMPEMDGLEACGRIRANTTSGAAYVIMLSVKGETSDKVNGLDTGADAYLPKPFELEELMAVVRTGLGVVEDRRRAMYDILTGLLRRRAFDEMVVRHLAARQRYGRPLSMVILGPDGFEAIKKTHSQNAGDTALKRFAGLLRTYSRPSDLLCRWGDEAFGWLLPEAGLDEATRAAGRMRAEIAATEFPTVGPLTISAGVGETEERDRADLFFRRVEGALDRARHGGGNRVSVSAGEQSTAASPGSVFFPVHPSCRPTVATRVPVAQPLPKAVE